MPACYHPTFCCFLPAIPMGIGHNITFIGHFGAALDVPSLFRAVAPYDHCAAQPHPLWFCISSCLLVKHTPHTLGSFRATSMPSLSLWDGSAWREQPVFSEAAFLRLGTSQVLLAPPPSYTPATKN